MIAIAVIKIKAALTILIPATDRCMIMITMTAAAAEIAAAIIIMIVMMTATINKTATGVFHTLLPLSAYPNFPMNQAAEVIRSA